MTEKPTNPKDAVGIRKWRYFSTVPLTVIAEVGVALLEGARKYGRHNYRVSGVRASVYVDAAVGHIAQWWEGEDLDPDTHLSHITKAIASLVVLRDAMIQDQFTDDRPPKANLDRVRQDLQSIVDEMFEKYPDAKPAHTEVADREDWRLIPRNKANTPLTAAELDRIGRKGDARNVDPRFEFQRVT